MNPILDGSALSLKVAELKQHLLDRHPRMPQLLQEIHKTLAAQPDNVTLLSEQEIGVIVEGLKVQTGVEFAAAATKSPSLNKSVNAQIKLLGADAF